MIYTFKVKGRPSSTGDELLETVHQAHGSDVMKLAHDLIEKHPDCAGVEVLLLQTQLFYLENEAKALSGPGL
jgi:hypothetical protein